MTRLWQGILMLFVLSTAIFLLARVSGSPAYVMLPPDAPPGAVAALEESMGLDKPLVVQYGIFVKATISGDLGDSLTSRRPVTEVIGARVEATAQLAGVGLLLLLVGIPLGTLAALKRDRWPDLLLRSLAALLQATPHFWVGAMLALIFGAKLGLLPVAGRSGWASTVMPALALSLYPMAAVLRMTRASVLRVLGEEYVLVARAKGLRETAVIRRHVLRNSLIPVVSLSSVMILVYFMTGSVVIEKVFAWPGLGYLAYQSVQTRDYPVLQGLALFFGVLFIVGALLVDSLMRILDPRTRLTRSGGSR